MQLFPTAGETTLWLRLPALLLAVLVPAVREEILFRGALQGFLHRVLGRGTGRTLLVYAGVSLCWAALHYHNTDAPLAKLGQIFVLGLLFCALARRWSVEVAVCAHMGLNAAALVAGLLLAGPAGA
jgi:membrane protease YdiL (CAAX protease family)